MGASGAVQTTVSINPDLGVPGMLYDSNDDDIVTRIATVAIPFGSTVTFVAGGTCKLPTTSNEVTVSGGGIAVIDATKPTGVGYEIGDRVSVLRRGRIWVATEGAVTELSLPFIRFTAGTAPALGGFAGATDAGKNVQHPNMQFVSATGAAGVAVVDVNMPT